MAAMVEHMVMFHAKAGKSDELLAALKAFAGDIKAQLPGVIDIQVGAQDHIGGERRPPRARRCERRPDRGPGPSGRPPPFDATACAPVRDRRRRAVAPPAARETP